jgi:hypothetical protein
MVYRRIFQFPILGALAIVAACASPPPRPEQGDVRRTVVSLPLDIGKLKIEKSIEYDDARLGKLYSYVGNMALQPDVFIYPNPFVKGEPPADVRRQSLGWAAESFKGEIDYAVELGAYDSVEVTGVIDVSHDWRYGSAAGKRVSFTITKDQNDFLSRAYFFAIDDLLLKVRISNYRYPGLGDNMDWFVEELLKGIRVARYTEDGGALAGVDANGDAEAQLLSRMDDLYVVNARQESIEKAILETKGGEVIYGEFDRKEPVTGPAEAGVAGIASDGSD